MYDDDTSAYRSNLIYENYSGFAPFLTAEIVLVCPTSSNLFCKKRVNYLAVGDFCVNTHTQFIARN